VIHVGSGAPAKQRTTSASRRYSGSESAASVPLKDHAISLLTKPFNVQRLIQEVCVPRLFALIRTVLPSMHVASSHARVDRAK